VLVGKRKNGNRRNDCDVNTRAPDAAAAMARLILFNKQWKRYQV